MELLDSINSIMFTLLGIELAVFLPVVVIMLYVWSPFREKGDKDNGNDQSTDD